MEQKRRSAKRGRPQGKSTPKNKPKLPNRAAKNNKKTEKTEANAVVQNVAPFVLIVLSIYIIVTFFVSGPDSVGGIGVFTRNIFHGLFGSVAILVPVLTIAVAVFMKRDIKSGFFKYRIIFSAVCVVLVASMFHLGWKEGVDAGYSLEKIFENGRMSNGGGFFGGYLAETLRRCVGVVGAWIFVLPLSAVFATFLFGYTPQGIIRNIIALVREHKPQRPLPEAPMPQTRREPPPPPQVQNAAPRAAKPKPAYNSFEDDDPIDLNGSRKNKKPSKPSKRGEQSGFDMGDNPFANSFTDEEEKINAPAPENPDDGIVFGALPIVPEREIFVPEKIEEIKRIEKIEEIEENFEAGDMQIIESIPLERDDEPDTIAKSSNSSNSSNSSVEISGEAPKAKKEYAFPPISYLTKDTSNANIDISEELHTTAQKLIDTLKSFGVKTNIYGYSRGPSITRYEISPDSGVKVNSIVTLANDISLNLAAEVRIEAPIPGKAAIGIEVPNKVREIVYLRTLLEDQKFADAASRITIALGKDVAGNAIFSDIAKMPHLLIAGATGMGKSICMNAIITSILYKASPNEVKLILIDPKKVELNIYNGIPHLLVPVVSDPRKAAGALAWAVNEMENRYMLIEEKGVRDFRAYNESIKDDPLSEPLTQIVIIIDELADLMLTAPADVEQSVNRLAAKARAAGLHLIVATQRPSVDVITGLIKANIPTRIAFTVVAPQDSRTIINVGGAEKLIGLGDMLYVPTGSKPIRVQGAFISEKDSLNVIEFWKKQSDGNYDEDIANEIEQEAARCNTKGAKIKEKEEEINPDDEFRKDSMLKSAIEVALDNGRISTSLLQTKLSLGYARAARIVDTMEKMGIIGPFEGSKPRKLLIDKQQFIEMTMKSENFE